MKHRRKRSVMTEEAAIDAVRTFARTFQRFGETSDRGMFCDMHDKPMWNERTSGNLQFMVPVFAADTTENFFEALRVLGGHKLPAKATR